MAWHPPSNIYCLSSLAPSLHSASSLMGTAVPFGIFWGSPESSHLRSAPTFAGDFALNQRPCYSLPHLFSSLCGQSLFTGSLIPAISQNPVWSDTRSEEHTSELQSRPHLV